MAERRAKIQWSDCRMAYASGMTLEAIAEKFGIKQGTVNSACSRQGWSRLIKNAQDAARLHQESKGLTVLPPKDAAVVLVEDKLERGMRHEMNILELAENAVEDLKNNGLPPIRNLQDVKILDDIARRAAGLEKEAQRSNCIVNLQILLGE